MYFVGLDHSFHFLKTMLGLLLGLCFIVCCLMKRTDRDFFLCRNGFKVGCHVHKFVLSYEDNIFSMGTNIFLCVLSISSVLFTGFVLKKQRPHHSNIINILSFGTAICGSAAIAAASPFFDSKRRKW